MKRILIISMIILGALAHSKGQAVLGEKVPNFSTLDQDGEKWTLKSNLKKADYLVIYFYPAAFTGGCTAQACSYRDQKGELAKVGASVAGVDKAADLIASMATIYFPSTSLLVGVFFGVDAMKKDK